MNIVNYFNLLYYSFKKVKVKLFMKKKLLITTIAMLSSLAMLTSCSDSSTPAETATDVIEETPAIETPATTDEEFIDDEDFMLDMDNVEISDEEMQELLQSLGIGEEAETFKEGEMIFEIGNTNLDDYDLKFEGQTLDFMYDSSIWIESGFPIDGTEVVLIDSNPVDFDAPANVYYTPMHDQLPSYISMNEYMQMIVDSTVGAFGVEVISSGVDFYEDFEVGMIETVERYTEELIDEMIAMGYFTEEDLDSIGGREVMLALPDMYQIFMVFRQGEDCYTFSGAYYSNDIKRDAVIASADGYIRTVTKK